jgi:hypothetical protein
VLVQAPAQGARPDWHWLALPAAPLIPVLPAPPLFAIPPLPLDPVWVWFGVGVDGVPALQPKTRSGDAAISQAKRCRMRMPKTLAPFPHSQKRCPTWERFLLFGISLEKPWLAESLNTSGESPRHIVGRLRRRTADLADSRGRVL